MHGGDEQGVYMITRETLKAEGDFIERCLSSVAHQLGSQPCAATLDVFPLTYIALYWFTQYGEVQVPVNRRQQDSLRSRFSLLHPPSPPP